MYANLRDFIHTLEQQGGLVRVHEPVSPYLEMTEIQHRVLANGGPAILFENVEGHDMPVLVNLFGTINRVALGMNRTQEELREVGEALAFLRQPEPPGGWKEAMAMMPLLKTVLSMKPKTVNKAPCQEIVLEGDDIDLSQLPIQTCWPEDASPLITWPLIVTQGPDKRDKTDSYNLGIYRLQVTGKNTTLMRWLKHRGGAEHWRKHKEKGAESKEQGKNNEDSMSESALSASETSLPIAEACHPALVAGKPEQGRSINSMPAAAVIGADPATILAAVTPVPDTISEYDFSGLYRGKKLELVDCKTIPLKVPAQAEIVLEGYVSLDTYGDEGPFGDHTGFYNAVEPFPVFTITAITMRKDPIYLSTYTGLPPDEPSILGEALNEVFIPLIQQQFPEIVDFWLPPEGCSYRIAVVSIKKAYPGHAKRVMMGVWSYLRQFMYTKWVIVVDETINCRDWKDVIWAISTNMDPARDITMIEQTPIDYLDFASTEDGLGSKIGLDATTKLPPETKREWGKKIEMSEEIIAKVTEKWQKYGL